MTVEELKSALSQSPGTAYARILIACIATWLRDFASTGLDVLLGGMTCVIEQPHYICEPPPLLTSDSWPTGTPPLLVYEPA